MADDLLPPIADTPPTPAAAVPAEAAPGALATDKETARAWKARIDRAIARQKLYHPWWEKADKAYGPSVSEPSGSYGDDISTKRIFTIVERKNAELFYQKPELNIAPSPLLEDLDAQSGDAMLGSAVAQSQGDLLNEKLGLDGVNVKRLAQRATFDYLLYGAGWTVMGYRTYTKPVEQPMTGPDGQPMFDAATFSPMTTTVDVPIKSECFWESLSPKQVLIPAEFTSTEFDKAPWLGHSFELSLTEARRLWTLPDEFKGSKANDDAKMDRGDNADVAAATDVVTGTRVVYRSSIFRDDIIHPDHLTELVIIDGIPEPVKHEDLALQKFDEQGQMSPDSLVGFPYHPLVIRSVTDAAYVMSDVTQWLPLERELNMGREQMIRQRNQNLQKWWGNGGAGKDVFDKIEMAAQGSIVIIPEDLYRQGAIRPMERSSFPPENFEFNGLLDNDLARASAVDATVSGTSSESGLTATEANLRQANVNVRLGWEQSFVADWFVSGATKFSTILQQFLSIEDAAKIIGHQRAQVWDSARKMIPARFAFSIEPDSSLRNDTPLHRKQFMEYYSFTAKDPLMNRKYLDAKLARLFHIDPTRAILPSAKVPQPKPEPAIPTVAIKDLAILGDPMVLAFIKANPQWGINIPPEVMQAMVQQAQMGQPEHGGKVAQAETLDKHATDETGAQNGSGQFNPMMGGGALPN